MTSEEEVVATGLESVHGNFSFAPPGLGSLPLCSPGLRPGLHSFAAPRLQSAEDREPTAEDREPTAEEREPTAEEREPAAEGPAAEC